MRSPKRNVIVFFTDPGPFASEPAEKRGKIDSQVCDSRLCLKEKGEEFPDPEYLAPIIEAHTHARAHTRFRFFLENPEQKRIKKDPVIACRVCVS